MSLKVVSFITELPAKTILSFPVAEAPHGLMDISALLFFRSFSFFLSPERLGRSNCFNVIPLIVDHPSLSSHRSHKAGNIPEVKLIDLQSYRIFICFVFLNWFNVLERFKSLGKKILKFLLAFVPHPGTSCSIPPTSCISLQRQEHHRVCEMRVKEGTFTAV